MNMKQFLVAALLLCLSVGTSAQSLKPQNLQGFDYRGFHFGFLLSLNTSDFYIRVKPDYDFENRLLSIDGVYGPNTETAVKQFQTKVGLPSTGIVDRATWEAIERKT